MTLQEPLVYASLPQADEVSSSTNAHTVVGRIVEDNAVMGNESNVTANGNSHPSEVIDPSTDSEDMALRSCHPSLTKTNVGAACVGALVGLILLGPIGAVILGAAAGYATTCPEGNIGHYARKVGDQAYSFYSSMKASTARA
jgi:hypothetical protein